MTGLYIHIPFCAARCRYCDFYSLPAEGWGDVRRFIRCLEAELQRLPETFAPETVFIGGGTPTALEADALAALCDAVDRRVDLSNVTEYSCEANPGTLTAERLDALRTGGVNRISVGVQSFSDRALRLLGRIHTAAEAVDSIRMLRHAGFANINLDLIQSIPGLTAEELQEDLRQAVGLEPEHISCYNLIYEPGTALTAERDAGRLMLPSEDEEADHYHAVRLMLRAAGYLHYEISNFCRPGMACRHNINYWQGGFYFGCGPSAHSHWNGARFGNSSDLKRYVRQIEGGQRPFDTMEVLDTEAKARETLVMWLRLLDGVDPAAFLQVTGTTLAVLCGEAIERLTDEGLLEWRAGRLALTPAALFVCDAVLSELV